MNEKIICAAIHLNDGIVYQHQPRNITSGIVIAGRRHHNCFLTLFQLKGESGYDKQSIKQGFITTDDRFVERDEAFKIAKEANSKGVSMEKEELKKIVKKSVEKIWYERRSINPVKEQTELLTDMLYDKFVTAEEFEEWCKDNLGFIHNDDIRLIFSTFTLIRKEK